MEIEQGLIKRFNFWQSISRPAEKADRDQLEQAHLFDSDILLLKNSPLN